MVDTLHDIYIRHCPWSAEYS